MRTGLKREGAILCPGCGKLTGARDSECLNCGRRNPGMFGLAGLFRFDAARVAPVLIGANVALFLVSLLLGGVEIGGGFLDLLSPSSRSLYELGAAGALPVFGAGKPYVILSAGWLHGSLLHIALNMYWLWNLFPLVGDAFGGSRALVIYQAGAGTGFLLTSFLGASPVDIPLLGGAHLTVGASASICALLGALLYYGRRTSSELARTIWRYVIFLAIFGAFVPLIDNAAHVGGFLGGYAVAAGFGAFSPERGKHGIWAALLLMGSGLAVLGSLLSG